MEFFNLNNIHLYLAMILSIINATFMCFVGYKFLQILQLSNYKNKGYWYWLKDTKGNYVSRIYMLSILSIACMLVTNFLLDTNNLSSFWSYIGLGFYFYFSCIFVYNLYNAPRKTPLKLTNRMNRLRFAVFIIFLIITFFLIALSSSLLPSLRFGVVALTPLLLPIFVPIVNSIMSPFEKANSLRYMMTAKRKIKKMPNLIRIGVTGSFGKTSTKQILKTILSEKYSICESPFSYNTPMGITKSIIQFLDFSHQVFIAEMGARFKGDIKELCELVDPQYGIILGIGNQHLQTFNSIDNIISTKKELVDYVQEKNGTIIFDVSNQNTERIYKECKGHKVQSSISDENCDFFATNIIVSENGTSFTLNNKNGNSIKCQTKLLGKHNIQNILCASALASELGLSLKEISNGINKIQPIEHRLQLIKNDGVIILDDSYNGSVEGSKCALEVLQLFKGNKIIVTPGLVELGKEEKVANINFGLRIGQIADSVIIVNVAHSQDLKMGLSQSNFDESNLYQADSLKNAQELLKRIVLPDSVVLFYNDLPDNYT